MMDEEEKGFEEVENIQLVCEDGKRFSLAKSTACISEYVQGLVDLDSTAAEVELKHIKSETISKIIEWMKYHEKLPPKPIPRPLKTATLKETVGEWDSEFVDVELEVVFEILLAANFLNVTALLELCCAKVASLMLGKTPKQIRKTFNIREDFTAEEEQAIRKEFAEFL